MDGLISFPSFQGSQGAVDVPASLRAHQLRGHSRLQRAEGDRQGDRQPRRDRPRSRRKHYLGRKRKFRHVFRVLIRSSGERAAGLENGLSVLLDGDRTRDPQRRSREVEKCEGGEQGLVVTRDDAEVNQEREEIQRSIFAEV